MADPVRLSVHPEGRRLLAPPRRIPPPANDNRAPMRLRLQRAAFGTAILLMAVSVAAKWLG
ncbi:hypothetical protein [Magnetospirillum sp. UT-4]|uniref:hypothetical protein n=1 Tax=Magnetospirillum sp. UT-4 TaxID=2681467 RepID=UPI00137EA423|nr:hypothetical protein [Magnetospirillum sp. UT-4]CAA7625776.1 hypothetical protein MTBUT4_70106 [Magnetospirillum sp. UT-4]